MSQDTIYLKLYGLGQYVFNDTAIFKSNYIHVGIYIH